MGDGEVVDVVRVGFDGDFGAFRDAGVLPDRCDNAGDSESAEPRRSATAQVDRVEARTLELNAPALQLLSERRCILIDGRAGPDGDREIAVGAATGAERDVDVEMADGHTRIYLPEELYRRRISPASEHSTSPMIPSEVSAARHSAMVSPVSAGSESVWTNPPAMASQTFCSESG